MRLLNITPLRRPLVEKTRKLVERAKGVLMDKQVLKEKEALRKIQQLSMNTRKSMREIAQDILLTAQIEN